MPLLRRPFSTVLAQKGGSRSSSSTLQCGTVERPWTNCSGTSKLWWCALSERWTALSSTTSRASRYCCVSLVLHSSSSGRTQRERKQIRQSQQHYLRGFLYDADGTSYHNQSQHDPSLRKQDQATQQYCCVRCRWSHHNLLQHDPSVA